ncbi:aldolase/citrate lyase family protein [Dactylosporangium sp. NPDC051484]|uniref:HpcH/HpaI aldolase family protein n=1 Tax=Dactylosporangium sp. NPDC051484 TaxID=3154942 RepID=UPI00344EE859
MNLLKERWARGETAFGAWCSTGSPFVAELMSLQGFHFVGLDAQHGLYGYDSLLTSLMAMARTRCTPIVRMPSSEAAAAGRVLDAGAHGVIFPMIETADDAAAAVAACRIHPAGTRSFGPVRAAQSFGRDPRDVSQGAACIIMIETARGIENAEEIAAVEGVDCLYIGPGDLAITLGLPPGLDPVPGPHAEAIDHVREVALRRNLAVGIPCGSAEAALRLAEQGFNFLAVGADTWWLNAQAATEAARLGLRDRQVKDLSIFR